MSQQPPVPPRRPDWLPAESWSLPSRYLQIGTDTIHYVDVGTGPTLLFVETGMWSFIWRDVINRLKGQFRCVALDFPGSGLSSPTTRANATIDSYATTLASVIELLRLDDVTLVVHDLGGPVALRYAGRHPGTISALVACQTFCWAPDRAGLRFLLRAMGSAPVRTFNTMTNLIPRITSGNFGVGRHLDKQDRQAFLGPTRDRRTRRTFHYLMRDAHKARLLLASIEDTLCGPLARLPLLTIFGEKNDPFHYQARWKRLFPHAIEQVVTAGHHYPMCDDPDLFATEIRSFLTARRTNAAAPLD